MKKFNAMTTGQIVACNYRHAILFRQYGIDFCSMGDLPFDEACQKAGVNSQTVLNELQKESQRAYFTVDFQSWPTDLLLDYILKFHHRRARSEGSLLHELAKKVAQLHATRHPELHPLQQQVQENMLEFENHLDKEEQNLFPSLYEQIQNPAQNRYQHPDHPNPLQNPITAIMAEHKTEREHWQNIRQLTNNYTTPDDGCATYWLFMERLKLFDEGLLHHFHLENNILFPRVLTV